MSRRCVLVIVVAGSLAAQVLPPRMGDFNRTGGGPFLPPGDAGVYREYGLELAEQAQYEADGQTMELKALRFKDSTGAFGGFHWLRPGDSKPVERGERGAQKDDTTWFQYGNYILIHRGAWPEEEHLDMLLSVLPRYERTAPPPIARHMPKDGLVPNSERFILGPVVLEKLAPMIPPSVAAFHSGAEGETAQFVAQGGTLNLALFTYPTPHLAREQFAEFQKIPGLIVKRSGPLVAAVLTPFSADEAEKLLARVRYEATLTWSQKAQPVQSDNVGQFLIAVLLLCLMLAGLMILAGAGLAGIRTLLGRMFPNSRFNTSSDPPIIRLHLSDR